MGNLIANLRVWQKSLLPIVVIGIICGGVIVYATEMMTSIADRYTTMLARDAQAAITGPRMVKGMSRPMLKLSWRRCLP